jgi:hypothetical protein
MANKGNITVRQLLYISTVHRAIAATIDPAAILSASRANNARDRITGLLFFNGKRFLQALEGEEAAVDTTFRRIQQDTRHYGLVLLSDRRVATREFGEWAMAYHIAGAGDPAALDRIAALAADAAPDIRATFEGLAASARAA